MSDPIPWWDPQVRDAELPLVRRVLESNYLNEGKVTREFEAALAARLGVEHAIATTSGTAAIFLSLAALGIGPGDEVVVPDVTFIATANAVRLAGATVVLADVDETSLNLAPAAFERAITPRTRAVVPVHVSGRAADMTALLEIAQRRGLAVVEDAAEGLLSRSGGRCLGTWGTTGCFSFSPNKTITTGQGGLIVTADAALAGRLRELKDQGRPVQGTGGDDIHPRVGFNFKLTNLQAAVGLGQMTYLDERLGRQRDIFETYASELAGVPGFRFPGFDIGGGAIPQWTDAIVEDRDALDRYLTAQGIGCRRFWHPLHTQAPYRQEDQDFPVSSRVASKALWLPSAYTMTPPAQRRVCAEIRQYFGVRESSKSSKTGEAKTDGT